MRLVDGVPGFVIICGLKPRQDDHAFWEACDQSHQAPGGAEATRGARYHDGIIRRIFCPMVHQRIKQFDFPRLRLLHI